MAPYIRASKSSRNSTLVHPTKNLPQSPKFSPIISHTRRPTSSSSSPMMGSVLLNKQTTKLFPSQRAPPSTITNGSLNSFTLKHPKSSRHLPSSPKSSRHLLHLSRPPSIRHHHPRPLPSNLPLHLPMKLPLQGRPSTTRSSFYLTNKLLQSIRKSNHPMMSSLLAVMTPDQVNHTHITGETPLHEAAKTGNVAAVQALLNVPGIYLNIEDNFGYTPLMLAAYCCHTPILHLLLDLPHLHLAPHLEQVAGTKPGLGEESRRETLDIIRAARDRRAKKEAGDEETSSGTESFNSDDDQIVKVKTSSKSNMTDLFSLILTKLSIKSLFQYPVNQAKKFFRQTFKRSGPKTHFRKRFGSKGYRPVREC